MIRTLAGFSTRNPWKVITLWVLLGVGLAIVGQALMYRVTESQLGDFLPEKYDSAAALKVAEDKFGIKPDANAVTMLVKRADGKPLGAADQQRAEAAAAALGRQRVAMPKSEDAPDFLAKDYSQTPKVTLGTVAPHRAFVLFSVGLSGNSTDPGLQNVFKEFRNTASGRYAQDGLRTGFAGGLADLVDSREAEKTTSTVAGALTIGLIVLLNMLVFRSALAALLPLLAVSLVGGAAAGAVVGTALLTGIKLDPSTPQLISVVLLGIGIDYFLFLLFRFRERLRAQPQRDTRDIAGEVTARVGSAITSAALTIVAAFATLGVASFGQFRVLGPAVAISVMVMLLASLTFMPALLAVTGRRMFWPSQALKRAPREGSAGRFGDTVARRPLAVTVGAIVLLGALAAGMAGMKMDYSAGSGGTGTPAAATAAEISGALPAGVSDPTEVYVTSGDGGALDRHAVDVMVKALSRTQGVGQVTPVVYDKVGDAARIGLYLTADPQSQKARDLVSGPVRATVAQHTPTGAEAHVGGTAAIFADISTAVSGDLELVFPMAAALIALILLVLLRSVLAPVVLMVSVGLGFAATLGASALVFQHVRGEAGVNFTLPLVLFLFVVALGTDYNILMSDRIREEMERPGPARSAVARAVRHTAPAIATAGLVLAGSFGSLAANPAPSTQQIGFATALGILLSAFVLSVALIPALAALLGRSLWWPVRPRRTARQPSPYEPGRRAGEPGPTAVPYDRVSTN
ncbi:MMPL family transporter [Streptomyces sp. NBC_00572]|uniref:MMPL family transporter n=1 Tax=Streptomyces sp. NBC_00572 TaxID=2903664 RepID=UPI00224D87BC|nr:MMPL family transporter [Streptomyces sp. NBC_00572]MCX4985540.1 MMPL family transporter [Streptomyces sp. NBC_00572]